MIYLKELYLFEETSEYLVQMGISNQNIHNTTYPFSLFSDKGLESVEFSEITILYGGNGSGKSTLLNVLANKANATKKSRSNPGNIFHRYVEGCSLERNLINPVEIKIITSDDIFDYLLDLRSINTGVDNRKSFLQQEYLCHNFSNNDYSDYEELKIKATTRKTSMAKFVRANLANNNVIIESNGETSLGMWQREIKEDAVYILDEPENSLSPKNILKLKKYIEESVRFYNCQFIIATHSPFLLGLENAVIYDLDEYPAGKKNYDDLENIKIYKEYFSK